MRATAELLVSEAFTEQARADAARHAAVARLAELTCTQLLAERIRAADELASRPHLARVLAERHQREQAQSGMCDPRRYSPATSRGVVFARRTPDGPYEVVSALGLPGWQVGEELKAQRIVDASRPLQER